MSTVHLMINATCSCYFVTIKYINCTYCGDWHISCALSQDLRFVIWILGEKRIPKNETAGSDSWRQSVNMLKVVGSRGLIWECKSRLLQLVGQVIHKLHGRWFNPWLFLAVCQSVLGQDREPPGSILFWTCHTLWHKNYSVILNSTVSSGMN